MTTAAVFTDSVDRYLRTVNCARNRYTRNRYTRNGCLEISGHNRLSRYSRIESLAYDRYVRGEA